MKYDFLIQPNKIKSDTDHSEKNVTSHNLIATLKLMSTTVLCSYDLQHFSGYRQY